MAMFGHVSKAFWRKGDGYGWPDNDPHGWVFLGRAIHQIGHMLHGTEWKGTEPGINLAAIAAGKTGLAAMYDTDRPTPASSGLAGNLISQMERMAPYLPDRERRDAVYSAIISRAQAGTLSVVALDEPTGKLQPCLAEWWRTPRKLILENRLRDCRINMAMPLGVFPATDASAKWLYTSTEDLARALGASADTVEGQGDMLEAMQEPVTFTPPDSQALPIQRATHAQMEEWIRQHYSQETLPHLTDGLFPQMKEIFARERNLRVIRDRMVETVATMGWSRSQGRK